MSYKLLVTSRNFTIKNNQFILDRKRIHSCFTIFHIKNIKGYEIIYHKDGSASGKNKEIAKKLNLSVRTIEGYREKIQEKMEVKNNAGIVVFAIKKSIYQIK